VTDLATAYAEAARALAAASSVVVCAHVDPDGDAIGSTLGLTHVLRRLGISAIPALAEDRGAPETYAFLPGFPLLRYASQLEAPRVLVALDTPNLERLGDALALAEKADTTIVLDHHPDNTSYGEVNLVDPGAAAVGQIVWRLLPMLGLPPDADIASCLYVALLTDTGRFQYSNSNAAVLRDAAAMIDVGLDVHEVYERVYENQTLGHMEIVGRVKSRVKLVNGGRVAYSWVTDEDFAETGAAHETTENLVDTIRVIGGPDVVFLAKIAGPTCRVSLRAKGHGDVGGVARHFGGGGHVAAAGFAFDCDLAELLERLLPLLPGGGEA
jgi:phosphoesterase RecJ-like protein